MRGLLFVILSFGITILAWGLYGPFLHVGQAAMSETNALARMRPFVCVGIAYFAIGVVVPLLLLYTKGEKGSWTSRGTIMSFFAGALGAIGALGIILSFEFGGRPSFVMPLVFGGCSCCKCLLDHLLGKASQRNWPCLSSWFNHGANRGNHRTRVPPFFAKT